MIGRFLNSRPVAWTRQTVLGAILQRLDRVVWAVAYAWRRLLRGTTFIAITGSVGKTTTKECLADILATRYRTARTWRNQNGGWLVALTILKVMPWHRYAVIELGTSEPGRIGTMARLVRPDVAIVTNVGATHVKNYRSIEDIAEEKSRLLESLSSGGAAILNGDDPRVSRMGDSGLHRIVRFGTGESCDLRGEGATASWPERLRLSVSANGESVEVRTQLLGTHLAPSVLAALAAATACGFSLKEAAEGVAAVAPFHARMQPVRTPDGVVFLRDDYNGSQITMGPALEVLERARAMRRVLVVSDFVDTSWKPRKRMQFLGKTAARVAEAAVFIGERCDQARQAAIDAGMPLENAHSFLSIPEASTFLKNELRDGDLVLLRGRHCDHLSRLAFAQIGHIGCWKALCYKGMLCDICWELGAEPGTLTKLEPVPPPKT